MPTEMTDALKTFKSFNLALNMQDTGSGEHVATCPFCHNTKKLYINNKEGMFDCKVCMTSGNKYTFLQLYYDHCLNGTTNKRFKRLSTARGDLPAVAFEDAGIAYDLTTVQWLIPVRNDKGSMVNLRLWNRNNNTLFSTGGCKAHLYNLDQAKDAKTIYVCEGEWDAIAMQWLIKKLKLKHVGVVAAPGANTFKEEWCQYFNGKNVIFLYDNDDPGRTGAKRAINILRQGTHCQSINKIIWPESFPNKFDIRDLITKGIKDPKKIKSDIDNMLDTVALHDRKSAGLVRTKFTEVLNDFSKSIYMSPDMKDGLLLQFAIVASNQLQGDPLWLFVVAPPGAGKTLLLQSLDDTDAAVFQSSLNPKTLVSGYKTTDGSDPSLLPTLIGKTLVIKDYTEIMNKPGGEQDDIYGVLRGAYDGRVERTYGSGAKRVYPDPNSPHTTCHFSMLAGVTNAIHGDNRANLGERFLKYQMVQGQYNPVKQIESAVAAAIAGKTPEHDLRESAAAFVESFQMDKVPTVPKWIQKRTMGLSQIVSVIRAVVVRKQGDLVYRPTAEIGTRLSKQLTKLGQCIAYCLGKDRVDAECYRLIKRVALDTCYGWHRDIVIAVALLGKKGGTRTDIGELAITSGATTHRCLEDLFELHAVTFEGAEELPKGEKPSNNGKKGKGRPTKIWRLTPAMQALWNLAKLSEKDVNVLHSRDSNDDPFAEAAPAPLEPSTNGSKPKTRRRKATPRKRKRATNARN